MTVRARMVIKEVDRGWSAMARALREMKNARSYVKVGVLDDGKGAEPRGKITNGMLAAVQEFGTRDGRIPARPFVATTFEKNKDKYIADLKVLAKGVYEQKMTIEKALDIMGLRMANDMKATVMSGDGVPPPNALSTLRRKLKKGKQKSDLRVTSSAGDGLRLRDKAGKFAARASAGVRTLIDTGRLIGSLSWAVIKSSQEGEKS